MSKLVTFWTGIQADQAVPIPLLPFSLTHFTEDEIAAWSSFPSKVARVITEYVDGSRSTRTTLAPRWDAAKPSDDPESLTTLWATDFGHGPEITNTIRNGKTDFWDGRTYLTHLLLRLVRHGHVEPVREYYFEVTDPRRSRFGTSPEWHGTSPPDWFVWRLDPVSGFALKKLADALWHPLLDGYGAWADDCFVAASHFVQANTRSTVDREIDLWIALEAMFGKNIHGASTKYLVRTAAAFTAEPASRDSAMQMLEGRYDVRCGYVHGRYRPSGTPIDRPFSQLYDEYVVLEDFVRRALRRYLRCRIAAGISREKIHEVLSDTQSKPSIPDGLPPDPVE
ncbi:MAG: hypothetical protein HZA54_16305 [Planctomycetes bacterium]|nr:hypothetical protein [Planctomycetota bacterium]